MCFAKVKLVEPTVKLKEEFLAMVEEHLKLNVNPDVWDFREVKVDFSSPSPSSEE